MSTTPYDDHVEGRSVTTNLTLWLKYSLTYWLSLLSVSYRFLFVVAPTLLLLVMNLNQMLLKSFLWHSRISLPE